VQKNRPVRSELYLVRVKDPWPSRTGSRVSYNSRLFFIYSVEINKRLATVLLVAMATNQPSPHLNSAKAGFPVLQKSTGLSHSLPLRGRESEIHLARIKKKTTAWVVLFLVRVKRL